MITEYRYSPDGAALHDSALEALTRADYALAYAPVLALREPHTLAEVTPEWLSEALGKAVPGAGLEQLVVVDSHHGMTSRKKWRLEWNEAGRGARLPAAVFAKATPEIDYHRESIAVLHLHEAEVNYYRVLHTENPGLAPDAYYGRSYPGGRFLILLEDLTAKACRPYWQADECSLEHARAVTAAQARFHARYWESGRLLKDLAWVRPRTKRFGWDWLRNSFHEARRAFLQRLETGAATAETSPAGTARLEVPAEVIQLLRRWDQHADAIFEHWEGNAHTVLHGDSHLGNTFSYPDGRAGYFDWQVMFCGHGLRDLSYFLLSALTHEQRVAHEKELFELYLETLAKGGIRLEREQAWHDYCLFAFDRFDAVIKEVVKGSYGHAPAAQIRSLKTISGCFLDNDVPGRLAHLIHHHLRH
jgi:Ecdysteroid kinase-like family